jgi:hypothetical protein
MTSSEDAIERSASAIIARAFDLDIEEHDAYKRIREQVLNRIIELLTRNPEKLMAILYRIDVPESAVSTIFDTALPPDVPDQLADLVMERQMAKARTRAEHTRAAQNDTHDEHGDAHA